MAQEFNNPLTRIRQAELPERKALYEEIYQPGVDGAPTSPEQVRMPSARRRRRLRIYERIMGRGHRDILEVGCASGDLTCMLAGLGQHVVGVDISEVNVGAARLRAQVALPAADSARLEFAKMNALELRFAPASFDYAISTSMIEHLQSDDVDTHLREVCRVLRPGGRYLVWCPNRLGHHKDRPDHLTMMSYRDLCGRLERAGFSAFQSPLFRAPPLVSARWKMGLEQTMVALRIGVMWSHLGVRNVLLVARK